MRRHRDQELARQMVFGKKRRRVKKADGGFLDDASWCKFGPLKMPDGYNPYYRVASAPVRRDGGGSTTFHLSPEQELYMSSRAKNNAAAWNIPSEESRRQAAEELRRRAVAEGRANPVQKDSGGYIGPGYFDHQFVCEYPAPSYDDYKFFFAKGGQPRQRRSIESRPAGGYGFGKRTKKAAGGIGKIRKGVY